MIVVDTNVISELMRSSPAATVLAWVGRQSDRDFFTTAITAAEVRYGIARLPTGRRRTELTRVADEVFDDFLDKILAFDDRAAEAYAELVPRRERAGRPIDRFDAQIAAICRVHGARLATRNGRDFDDTGVTTIDPWQDDEPLAGAPPRPA